MATKKRRRSRSSRGHRHGDSTKLSVADAHQLRILKDSVRNPLKGLFLGGPSAEEAEYILRSKFRFTSEQIQNMKGSRKRSRSVDCPPHAFEWSQRDRYYVCGKCGETSAA